MSELLTRNIKALNETMKSLIKNSETQTSRITALEAQNSMLVSTTIRLTQDINILRAQLYKHGPTGR